MKSKGKALTFDDILLVPRHTDIPSRYHDSIDLKTDVSPYLRLKTPIISANMESISESKMAIAMWKAGGLGIVHRYNTIEQQITMQEEIAKSECVGGFSIGVNGDAFDRASALYDCGASVFCVDVAHGDSRQMISLLNRLYKGINHITLIAGNVSTPLAAIRLFDAGAHSVKVSVGGGSCCTTRIVTGSGVPTLQAVMDCRELMDKMHYSKDFTIISDGGIRNSGDCVKSFAAGASAVMLGSALSGTDECPGETDSEGYKVFRGMASSEAMFDWRPELARVAEGVSTKVKAKGPVSRVIDDLMGGIRSGMTYQNSRSLKELYELAEYVEISSAGLTESKPHIKDS